MMDDMILERNCNFNWKNTQDYISRSVRSLHGMISLPDPKTRNVSGIYNIITSIKRRPFPIFHGESMIIHPLERSTAKNGSGAYPGMSGDHVLVMKIW